MSSYPDEIASVFEQVLLVCDQQGLLGNELFAINGCKISSNAAKEDSGTFKELGEKQTKIRRQIRLCLKGHQRLDRRKTLEREGKDRLTQTLDSLDKHFNKIGRFLKTHAPRMGKAIQCKEVKSNIADNESVKMTTSTKSGRAEARASYKATTAAAL